MSDKSIKISGTQDSILVSVTLQAHIEKGEDSGYVSSCPSLGTYSQGKTIKEAQDNIIEATHMFLQNCINRGVLKEVLIDRGFRQSNDNVQVSPPSVRVIDFPVKIPDACMVA